MLFSTSGRSAFNIAKLYFFRILTHYTLCIYVKHSKNVRALLFCAHQLICQKNSQVEKNFGNFGDFSPQLENFMSTT